MHRFHSLLLIALVLLPPRCLAQYTGTQTQSLTIHISALAELSVPGSVTLTSNSAFQPFVGTIAVNYRARTIPSGSGSLTVQASSEFSPAGGPSIASGQLTYTCGSASLGTSCAGTQTVSTTSQTPVVTLGSSACTGGGGPCSSTSPNTVSLSLSVPDLMSFKAGTYSSALTFTISAI